MPDPVKERPHLPITKTRDPEVRTWGNAIIRVLSNMFMEIGQRLNGSIHKDGEIAMEAPFTLGTYTEAELPPAADYPWAIVTIEDGAGGRHFRGSDGVDWLVLDSFDPVLGNGRTPIFSDFTCYVRTDGSDSNDGLTNTAGGAFLTIQKAIDTVAQLDLQIYDAYIQVADGTYTDGVTLKGLVGAGTCFIIGNTTTLGNVLIDSVEARAIEGIGYLGVYDISGLKIQTTGTYGIWCENSYVRLGNNDWGVAGSAHIVALSGGFVQMYDSYAISGSSQRHIFSVDTAVIQYPNIGGPHMITLDGTPDFAVAYADCGRSGFIYVQSNIFSFSGSATGKRFNVYQGNIDGNRSTLTLDYFPGDEDGTLVEGSAYAGITVIDASGSNANGYYQRDEHGKLEQWITSLTLTYVNASACQGTWTFPTEFIDSNSVVTVAITSIAGATPDFAGLGVLRPFAHTETQVSIQCFRIFGTTNFQPGDEVVVEVHAVGRSP